ncbi:MAG: hypothetical protein AB199_01250 [Parcubacteria bacterium C7867-004]|nr:MAG: hypothetical protein AB199_01250 [Parcubacteria bacterium C7867-004]
MNIDYLTQLLTNRLAALALSKDQAFQSGDLERINLLDVEMAEVENTLSQLRLLSNITIAAAVANTTPAQIVSTGLDAVQNIVQGPSAGAVINGYDISAYATDPLYEQKVQGILDAMPAFVTAEDIDTYVQEAAPGSPVTGAMILAAASENLVDSRLMMAIMRNDSQFGTQGVGARTNNPGNVGNTGTSEQMYPSWDEGVRAGAEWLSRHRAVAPVAQEIVIEPVPEPAPTPAPKKTRKLNIKVEEDPRVDPIPPVETPIDIVPVEEVPQATTTPALPEDPATTTPS